MKKKNIKTFLQVFSFALFFYIIAGAFIFFMQFDAECTKFDNYNRIRVDSLEYLLKTSDVYSDDVKFGFLQHNSGEYPSVFALMNSDGELIASSRSAFVLDYSDETEKYIDTYIVDAYSYITPVINDSITDFVNNCKHGCNLRAEWLSVYKDGENYIPVSCLLFNAFSPDDGKLAVTFTDFEPTFTAREKNGSIISLYGYNNTNKPYLKYYKKLDAYLNDFINRFSDYHKNSEFNSGGAFKSDRIYQYEYHQNENGEKLCFYFNSQYDPYFEAFVSDSYRGILIYMGFLFFAAALIIYFVLKGVNNKKEKINKSRRAFVSAAAHELKTPLAVIANKSECILENISPEQTAEYVNSIYDESKRMSRMVKTLLQYNNISSDTKTEKRKEKLSQIISEQALKFQTVFEAKNIKYSESFEGDDTVYCNKALTAIAIENFFSNAVKFTPEGGEIKITVFETKDRVKFEIFNSGSNISKDDAPHIWEELYSADKSRTRTDNSTGMGLAICRLVFELHNFKYGFMNKDSGVVFYFFTR